VKRDCEGFVLQQKSCVRGDEARELIAHRLQFRGIDLSAHDAPACTAPLGAMYAGCA
jgi:hypothetical protein